MQAILQLSRPAPCNTWLMRTGHLKPPGMVGRQQMTTLTRAARPSPRPRPTIWLSRHSTEGSSSPQQQAPYADYKILKKLARIENSMRYHGYSVLRLGLGIIIVAGLGVYLFRDHLRENVADEVSTVATKSLADENVRQTAQELSVSLLQALLTDARAQEQTVGFLKGLCQQPETQAAVIDLLGHVVAQPYTQQRLAVLLKESVTQALADDAFRQQLAGSLHLLLKDENIRRALKVVVQQQLEDEENRHAAKRFLSDVISSRMVTEQATALSKSVAQGVVRDPEMQHNTGDAMWSAFTYVLTPSWMRKSEEQPSDPPPSDGAG